MSLAREESLDWECSEYADVLKGADLAHPGLTRALPALMLRFEEDEPVRDPAPGGLDADFREVIQRANLDPHEFLLKSSRVSTFVGGEQLTLMVCVTSSISGLSCSYWSTPYQSWVSAFEEDVRGGRFLRSSPAAHPGACRAPRGRPSASPPPEAALAGESAPHP